MKFLHITFHKGCEKEIQYVFTQLGYPVDTWRFQDGETDPCSEDNYRITHARAQKCWNVHRTFFESYDGIVTSDTCPLSRPFLQNHWRKPLLIWVCNRFDYLVYDEAFNGLLRDIPNRPLVRIFSYTFIEPIYARYIRGVEWGNETILKPIGKHLDTRGVQKDYSLSSSSPRFYVPPYGNETELVDLRGILVEMGVSADSAKYSQISELLEYQGIVTIPYAWSTFALFERMQLGMVVFVPSESFLMQLFLENDQPVRKWWFQDPFYLAHPERLVWTEWYCPENREAFVYFDSWLDLAEKIQGIDYTVKSAKIIELGAVQERERMGQWKSILNSVRIED